MATAGTLGGEPEVPQTPPAIDPEAFQELSNQIKNMTTSNTMVTVLVKMVEDLNRRLEEKTDMKSFSEHRKAPLIQQKGLDLIRDYDGKPEDFDPWRASLFGFLGEDEWITELLRWTESVKDQITEEDVRKYGDEKGVDAVKISKQLHAVLRVKPTRTPFTLSITLTITTE